MRQYTKTVEVRFTIDQGEDILEYTATVLLFCVHTIYGEDADGNRGMLLDELDDFQILSIHLDGRLLEPVIYSYFEELIADKLQDVDLSEEH